MKSSVGNVTETQSATRAPALRAWFFSIWAVVCLIKLALAATLAPFGDEAWYWQESRRLDWSFSDIPVATPALIRLGESVLGHGVLAMRLPFLILGALLPLIVVHTARRMFGARAGWTSGLLALGLPLLATLGIFALPDVPLTFSAACAFAALARATRDDKKSDWAALGVALACAWLSHYRAGMLVFAGLGFLAFSPRGRRLWISSGLWLSIAIMLLGMAPLWIFNNANHWSGLAFQLVERNPWAFHADALLQPLEQAIVCTPLLYLAMWWAAWKCCQRAPQGAPWDLLAACILVPLLGYFVLGCFADDVRLRIHWPLLGYLPALMVLPVLIGNRTSLASSAGARMFFCATFALMALGNLLAFAYLAIAAIPGGALALTHLKAFPEHFVGWSEISEETRVTLAKPAFANALLVADNFMLAAELDFALGASRTVYTLDHPLNTKHGRSPQLALWHSDEAGLREHAGSNVLLVVEPTARRERERDAWLQSLCTRVDHLKLIDSLALYGARKRYALFSGQVRAELPSPDGSASTEQCQALIK